MFVIAGLTPDQVRNIKAAIARATTLEEIERLNQMLRTGQIPGDEKALAGTNGKILRPAQISKNPCQILNRFINAMSVG